MPTPSDGSGNQGGIGVNRSLRPKAEVHLFLLEIFGCNFISLQCAWTTDLNLKNVSYFMIAICSKNF